MNRSLMLALAFFAVLLAGCYINPDFPKLSQQPTAEVTESQTLAVSGTPAIEIVDFAGVINVREGAPGQIAATVTKQSRLADQAEAEAQLNEITWSLTETANGARLAVEGPENVDNLNFGISAAIELALPPGSDLSIELGAGQVTLDQLSGDVDFNSGASEVTAILPADASFNLRVTGGVAAVESDFAGVPAGGLATDINHTVGNNPTQTLTFNMGAGKVSLKEAP